VGATSEQLGALEERLELSLPEVYRKWLSVCNGMVAGPGGIYGTETGKNFLDVEWVLQLHPQWLEQRWLPVAGDGNGNHYVLDLSRRHIDEDAVFFIDVSDDPEALSYIVASDLRRFFAGLLSKELGDRRWPFDREFMLQADPQIVSVEPPYLLPWGG
jgi:cell wall assembly regulator SMI1